eukprot:scaffold1130_cov195-Pinguiococcus_pyrenoidosus.AAC.97
MSNSHGIQSCGTVSHEDIFGPLFQKKKRFELSPSAFGSAPELPYASDSDAFWDGVGAPCKELFMLCGLLFGLFRKPETCDFHGLRSCEGSAVKERSSLQSEGEGHFFRRISFSGVFSADEEIRTRLSTF